MSRGAKSTSLILLFLALFIPAEFFAAGSAARPARPPGRVFEPPREPSRPRPEQREKTREPWEREPEKPFSSEPRIKPEAFTYTEGRTEELLPWLKLRLPDDISTHSYVKREANVQVDALREAPFNANQVIAISLFKDTPSEKSFELIPSQNRRDLTAIDAPSFGALFQANFGFTFLVLGHIENGAFVARDSGGKEVGRIGVRELVRKAEESGVTLIPIGCGTAQSSRAGVVNEFYSVDAIDRVRAALPKATNYLEFYQNIASSTLQLAFDISVLSEIGKRLTVVERETDTEVGEIYIPARLTSQNAPAAASSTAGDEGGGEGVGGDADCAGCGCAVLLLLVVIGILAALGTEEQTQVPALNNPDEMIEAIEKMMKEKGLSKEKLKKLETLRDTLMKGRSTYGR